MRDDRGDGVHDAVALARLALEHGASAELRAACGRAIDAWRGLPADDSPGLAPAHPVGLHDVLRADEARPGLSAGEALRSAPDSSGGAFRVPRVADVQ